MISSSERSALSQELRLLKHDLAQTTAELEKREAEKTRTFHPIRPTDPNAFGIPSNDQKGFLHSLADERWVTGGVRSGKTEVMVYDADLYCRGAHPVRSSLHQPPVKIRFCGPKWRENVKGVLIAKFHAMCRRDSLLGGSWATAWSEAEHKLHYANGSFIQFKSYEEDPDTFDGIDLDAVYLDEPPAQWMYTRNIPRLIDRKGYLVGGMAPERGITWLDDHLDSPPAGVVLDHFEYSSLGNPYLSKAGIEQLKAQLGNDPDLIRMKLYGESLPIGGLCVPQFDQTLHIIPDREIEDGAYRVFCIDTHQKEPTAMLWAAWEGPDRLLIYRAEKNVRTIPEWQQYIRAQSTGEKIHLWLGDEPNTPQHDSLGRTSILQQFREGPNGLPIIQVAKGPGSVESGIFKLRSMFARDPLTNIAQIYIFQSCEHGLRYFSGRAHGSLAWELRQWGYRTQTTTDEEILREKPRERGIHYCSCLRYIAMAGADVVRKATKADVLPKYRHSSVGAMGYGR